MLDQEYIEKCKDLVKILNEPDELFPDSFVKHKKANAFLLGLCQDAAYTIETLIERSKCTHQD